MTVTQSVRSLSLSRSTSNESRDDTQCSVKISIKEIRQSVIQSPIEDGEFTIISHEETPVVEKELKQLKPMYFKLPKVMEKQLYVSLHDVGFMFPRTCQSIREEIAKYAREFMDAVEKEKEKPKVFQVVANIEVLTREEVVVVVGTEASGRSAGPSSELIAEAVDKLKTKRFEEGESHDTACLICLDEIHCDGMEVVEMPCAHVFHKPCIVNWFQEKVSCPSCRFEVSA